MSEGPESCILIDEFKEAILRNIEQDHMGDAEYTEGGSG